MHSNPLPIRRLKLRLTPDPSRTILRPFLPATDPRATKLVERVLGLTDDEVSSLLASITDKLAENRADLYDAFSEHYQTIAERIAIPGDPSPEMRNLIGAYFTMEYAFESAALCNPSIVPSVSQDGLAPGEVRFFMSLRAIGEGHISSIVFRRGVIDAEGDVRIEPIDSCHRAVERYENQQFERDAFRTRLIEMGGYGRDSEDIFDKLPAVFTTDELSGTLRQIRSTAGDNRELLRTADNMLWLAKSNYEIRLPPGSDLTGFVLFPISEAESNGMEDMRLVQFIDNSGQAGYFGTYTAYNGSQILPQIIQATSPTSAVVHTLAGKCAQNKGLALFPRLIGGCYAMIGRLDGENLFLMKSRDISFWNDAVQIQQPRAPWEFVQIGNCGSPIETDAGWLLLTHGVGPMRRYCIGASLLDRDDPSKVIAQLPHPLLEPTEQESSGYVPNVVYSCGGMVHNGHLVIPYGISDAATGFAVVSLDEVLGRLC
jgi:predicted GH43/DUF377 family glycosyl hydrolase